MTEVVLVRARYGLLVKVLMVCLISGMAVFFAAMSVLVSHASFLECRGGPTCKHVERYPLGVVNETPLPPITRADVRWDTGGRSAALKLVLSLLCSFSCFPSKIQVLPLGAIDQTASRAVGPQ